MTADVTIGHTLLINVIARLKLCRTLYRGCGERVFANLVVTRQNVVKVDMDIRE